jgi:crossover junction endodeoxyribonuclease RuvC
MAPPASPRRVLGIDPGTRLLGWGVVEQQGRSVTVLGHGVLRANPRQDLPARLGVLAGGLRQVVETHRPTEAAIEETFHGRSARAALSLGEGRGAAIVVVAEAGLPVTGYANNVVKRAVTGAGRAGKERVQAMVMRLLGLEQRPETLDASDALALALCHLQQSGGYLQQAGARPPGGPASGMSPRIAAALKAAQRTGRPPRRR